MRSLPAPLMKSWCPASVFLRVCAGLCADDPAFSLVYVRQLQHETPSATPPAPAPAAQGTHWQKQQSAARPALLAHAHRTYLPHIPHFHIAYIHALERSNLHILNVDEQQMSRRVVGRLPREEHVDADDAHADSIHGSITCQCSRCVCSRRKVYWRWGKLCVWQRRKISGAGPHSALSVHAELDEALSIFVFAGGVRRAVFLYVAAAQSSSERCCSCSRLANEQDNSG
jgi:hypothetical protein